MPVIVGAPRSGTTLLRFMLDSHPDLAIPPETGFLALGPTFRGRGDALRERFFQTVTGYPEEAPGWPDFEIPGEVFRDALARVSPFTVAEGYREFYRLYAGRFGKSRWGDKTPLYCRSMPAIRKVLPEARFIHLIRDGRDVALSLRNTWFSPGREVAVQAAFWRDCVLAARRAGLGRPDYLEIRYEELVLKPRESLRQIADFIELGYDDAMLTYHTRTPARLVEHKARCRPDGSLLVSREARLRQQRRTTLPLDPGLALGWKTGMSAGERTTFLRVAGQLLESLGYEV